MTNRVHGIVVTKMYFHLRRKYGKILFTTESLHDFYNFSLSTLLYYKQILETGLVNMKIFPSRFAEQFWVSLENDSH